MTVPSQYHRRVALRKRRLPRPAAPSNVSLRSPARPPHAMYYATKPGWIEVISGVMFSGKSEELIRRVRRAMIAHKRVQVFKSHLDDRFSVYSVTTHDGVTVEARPVSCALEIAEQATSDVSVVAIDEVQFLDDGIIEVATALAERGVRVILAGTDTDFRGEPFGVMPHLLAIAEIVDKLHAICVICGEPACRNQRLINGHPAPYDSPTIMVGGRESYEARCRHCHQVPQPDAGQTTLL
jgi:thymidine kinase